MSKQLIYGIINYDPLKVRFLRLIRFFGPPKIKSIDFLKKPKFSDLSEHGVWSREWPQSPRWCWTSWCNSLNLPPALTPCGVVNVLITSMIEQIYLIQNRVDILLNTKNIVVYNSKSQRFIEISTGSICLLSLRIMHWFNLRFEQQPPAPDDEERLSFISDNFLVT